jgi:hypothetical protein
MLVVELFVIVHLGIVSSCASGLLSFSPSFFAPSNGWLLICPIDFFFHISRRSSCFVVTLVILMLEGRHEPLWQGKDTNSRKSLLQPPDTFRTNERSKWNFRGRFVEEIRFLLHKCAWKSKRDSRYWAQHPPPHQENTRSNSVNGFGGWCEKGICVFPNRHHRICYLFSERATHTKS